MPFALVFGAATALVALVLFNSGMLANAKTRLQNAADAGAYSAGVLQARDHNFSALTNRAMVANQAAVAQLVSLKSYLEDAVDTRDRMSGPVLGTQATIHPTSKPAWDAAKSSGIKTIAKNFNKAAPWAVQGLDKLIAAYATAQQSHHAATAIEMVVLADEVVKRNDPNAAITKGVFTAGRTSFEVKSWDEYTEHFRANDPSTAADRFADVVVNKDTTDNFTRFRPSVPNGKWEKKSVKWCVVLPNHIKSSTSFVFGHAGGTLLSKDKRSWEALDATMGGGFASCTFWAVCGIYPCPKTLVIPILDVGGSGGGLAGKSGYDSLTGYTNNPTLSKTYGGAFFIPAGAWRYKFTGPGASLDKAGGLQDYYRDVKDFATKPANQSAELNGNMGVTFEVERKAATIHTSTKLLPNSKQLAAPDGMKGDTMRALSSASAYFYRSTANKGFTRSGWSRSDGKTEMANLFSPYWQSRLVDRSLADRAASWAAQ